MKRRKLKKVLLRALITLGVLLAIPVGLQESVRLAHFAFKIRPFQAEARARIAPFLDDLKLLAEQPVFPARSNGSNAAAFLNFRLEWAPSTPNLVRSLSTDPPRIGLPKELAERLKAWGKDFPRHHSEINYEEVELTWMNEIKKFDYWDIIELSQPEVVFENGFALDLYLTQTLTPQFEELALLGKVRLLRGLYEGNLELAMEETRHWADLLYSTETLLGGIAAIAVLRAQTDVWDHLHRHVQTHAGDYRPVPRENLDRARRAVLGHGAWFSVFTPAETLEQAYAVPTSSLGLCAGLAKGMLRGLLTRPLLEPHFLLERDFRSEYAALDEVVSAQQDRCRLSHLKELWRHRRSRLVWLGLVGDNSWDWINLHVSRRLPWVRKAWGVDLASLFQSNGLSVY